MKIITILFEPRPDGRLSVVHYESDGITPDTAAEVCRLVALDYQKQAIRREMEQEREEGDNDPVPAGL
jgi:hypothetical protein